MTPTEIAEIAELRRLWENAPRLPWWREGEEILSQDRDLIARLLRSPEDGDRIVAAVNAIPALLDKLSPEDTP